MSTQLQQFSFEKDGLLTDVRVQVGEDGEPWFVAKDIADALGYNTKTGVSAITRHIPTEWKGMIPNHTLGGSQEVLCLSEQGMYFFVARSDKPKALPFQKWIAGTVLPSIRKHGYFQLRDMSAPVRQVIDLQKHALDLFGKLKKETDAESREYLYSLLQSVSSLLNQPAPPITSIGKTAIEPTEDPLVAKFFDRVAMFEAQGYQLNHSRNQYVAINMNEFINLCAEEKLPTIASNEWKEALRTSERFVGVRTVNSAIKSRAVRCWLFTAEVSA